MAQKQVCKKDYQKTNKQNKTKKNVKMVIKKCENIALYLNKNFRRK